MPRFLGRTGADATIVLFRCRCGCGLPPEVAAATHRTDDALWLLQGHLECKLGVGVEVNRSRARVSGLLGGDLTEVRSRSRAYSAATSA